MSDRELLFMMSAEQAEAFARLVEAADRGDGDAACRLGDMYREGLGGLRASPKQTFRWYSRSAECTGHASLRAFPLLIWRGHVVGVGTNAIPQKFRIA